MEGGRADGRHSDTGGFMCPIKCVYMYGNVRRTQSDTLCPHNDGECAVRVLNENGWGFNFGASSGRVLELMSGAQHSSANKTADGKSRAKRERAIHVDEATAGGGGRQHFCSRNRRDTTQCTVKRFCCAALFCVYFFCFLLLLLPLLSLSLYSCRCWHTNIYAYVVLH